ncbi:NAD(P)/FAD-dependent oxidoreductase [Candidatus Bathyarchaeota archaeon]|nr:NAD(P)/FAD-dependent oxidoreductase [Candidatus Bathyarchaeota archaeon]
MKTEAAVIGAGPAGLLAAEAISVNGFNVEVFEEHSRVGHPVHCAGMISVEGFKRLGIDLDPVFHQNTVYGGRVFSSDGSCITIRDRKPRAYIIDRGCFDTYLSERAESNGVKINKGIRVERILFKQEAASGLLLDGSEVSSKIVIDAEGARGRLLARSGIDTGQMGVFNGFNVELEVGDVEPDMVEVWFNHETAKELFTWVIPIGENRVRCGLATSRNNGAEALRGFIMKRFRKEAPRSIHGGLVCTGGPVDRTVYPGLMLVGDVAGQVKPTTAGGVVIGGLCARLAGETAVKALGVDSLQLLGEYEREWRRHYGSELQSMLFLRRIMNGVDDERLNRMLHAFIEEGLEEKFTILVEEGDMDMQAEIIKRALTDPVILGALAKSVGRLAVSELFAAFGF